MMKLPHTVDEPALTPAELRRISRSISDQFAPVAEDRPAGLVLMPVDPFHLHAYWSMEPDDVPGAASMPMNLSVHCARSENDAPFDAPLQFNLPVTASTGQCDVRLPLDQRNYAAELHVGVDQIIHSPLLRSLSIQTPVAHSATALPHLQEPVVAPHPAKEPAERYYDEAYTDALIRQNLVEQAITPPLAAVTSPERYAMDWESLSSHVVPERSAA